MITYTLYRTYCPLYRANECVCERINAGQNPLNIYSIPERAVEEVLKQLGTKQTIYTTKNFCIPAIRESTE